MTQFKPDPMGSYPAEDVQFLLRDLSAFDMELSTELREQKIQSGTHYSEMLPVEYQPDANYMALYEQMVSKYAEKVASCVAVVSEKVQAARGIENLVLVSLARAGTPVGILMKRYYQFAYGATIPHYSISIIRGRGVDLTAIAYIFEQHPYANIQFVDGWTGKGAISRELESSVAKWNEAHTEQLDAKLAVLADPGHCAMFSGTREDFLIPSACLNSTVSGLVSRTVLNEELLAPGDFHGAKYYRELASADVSSAYIDAIVPHFSQQLVTSAREQRLHLEPITWAGAASVEAIQQQYGMTSMNHIKPGIGETTRVLLRRMPWKILVNPQFEQDLDHIYLLAKTRNVPIEIYENMTYACCGLIKELSE